jgi:hypothetical protein
MKITTLRSAKQGIKHQYEDPLRQTFCLELQNVLLTGRNIHYPNCLLYTDNILLNPYDERVMSLQKNSFYDNDEWEFLEQPTLHHTYENPCFFFVYNVDNYYHYLYDSLPMLHAYFKLKEVYPNLELLLQTSHPSKPTLSPFISEFLIALGIPSFQFAQPNTLYKKLFVASSLTHGDHSNSPPSSQAYEVWPKLRTSKAYPLPKRFYISRRSWIHGKTDNIGTNYTLRRKCVNEDAVVELLGTYGFEEIFTELLTTDEKIFLFQNAECVAGIIGGGMANLLLSPSQTKSLCISTPYFLDINKRFEHSMNHTQILYSSCASHTHPDWKFKPFSRVKVSGTNGPYEGCIGEVEENVGKMYTISLSLNDVAGFSQDFKFEKRPFYEDNLIAIDQGLNSPFEIDLGKLETDLKSLLDSK